MHLRAGRGLCSFVCLCAWGLGSGSGRTAWRAWEADCDVAIRVPVLLLPGTWCCAAAVLSLHNARARNTPSSPRDSPLPPPFPASQLCAEDYLWWWRSYYRGGSIAVYVLVYSIGFLVNTLHK